MSKAIIFTDPHFTDNPLDEYRWQIFDFIKPLIITEDVQDVYCLGDLSDRKDRHSSILVNKLVEKLHSWLEIPFLKVTIISGNHDAPLNGPHFWQFFNYTDLKYIIKPELDHNKIWLLPFHANPVDEWKSIVWSEGKAAFMHQTLPGVLIEGDRVLEKGTELPKFPSNFPLYSGDVHRPQKFGWVTYVGTPHPIKFSETWNNRILILDLKKGLDEYREVWVPSIKRAILDLNPTVDLNRFDYKQGDQVKIRYYMQGDNLALWPAEEDRIRTWAQQKGIHIASIEPILQATSIKEEILNNQVNLEQMLLDFCTKEKLGKEVQQIGLEFLKEAQ